MNPSLASFTFYQRTFGTYFDPELYHAESRLTPTYRTESFGFTSGKNYMWVYNNYIKTYSANFYDNFFFSWKSEIVNTATLENHDYFEKPKEDADTDPYLLSRIRSDDVMTST